MLLNVMEMNLGWWPSLCVAIVIVVFLINSLCRNQPVNYPPGPFAWPIIQNFNVVNGGGLYGNLLKLRGRYGDIFRLKLGQMSMIVVFGIKNVGEVLFEKGDIFKNRPNRLYFPTNVIKNKGIFWTNGEVWEKLTGLLRASQNDISRQHNMEREILKEFECTAAEIEQKNGEAFNPEAFIIRSVFNVICAAAVGKRFDYGDPDLKKLGENISFIMAHSKTTSPVNIYPIIAPFVKSKLADVLEKEEETFNLFRQKIKEHSESLDSQNPRDYIDMYLTLDPDKKSHDAFSEHNFLRSMVDLYLGGSDTTTSMLLWSLTYFIRYPYVQEKCREEVDSVVGKDRLVTGDDMEKLPYTSAAMKELRRIAGSIVVTALRTNTCDTTIGPYQIPKDSIVICDLRQQHLDPDIWSDPTDFRPERFLEESDKLYYPFGLGPRTCPAQKIAEMLLSLYLVNIIHRFTLSSQNSEEQISLDSFYTGVSLRPKPANMIFKRRT